MKPVRHIPNMRNYRSKLWIEMKTPHVRDDYGTPAAGGYSRCQNADGSYQWCLANVDYRFGKEIEIAKRTTPTANVRITTTFNPHITVQNHRFVNAKNGEIYEIHSLNNIQDQDTEMILIATSSPRVITNQADSEDTFPVAPIACDESDG